MYSLNKSSNPSSYAIDETIKRGEKREDLIRKKSIKHLNRINMSALKGSHF